jgi:hypothetical protein
MCDSLDEQHEILCLEFPSYVLPSTSLAWTPLHAVREPILIHDVVRQVILDNFSELLRAKWHLKADSHIACRSHAAPMSFPCHAVPLRV